MHVPAHTSRTDNNAVRISNHLVSLDQLTCVEERINFGFPSPPVEMHATQNSFVVLDEEKQLHMANTLWAEPKSNDSSSDIRYCHRTCVGKSNAEPQTLHVFEHEQPCDTYNIVWKHWFPAP